MVKKYFQIVGILTLACFSFIFTEKTSVILRDNDELMKTIKEKQEEYKIESVNANINGDTITPGINGKQVNNSKSYNNMKRLGEFNENLLIYDLILPEISLTKTYDKYIVGGNPNKNMVSIIFKVNDKIDELLKTIDNEYNYNFLIDGKWLESNEEILKDISSTNNIINGSYGGNYLDSSYNWINSVINRYSNQENSYCYQEEKREEYLKICALHKSYTIIPSLKVSNNPLIEIKNNLNSGDIIVLDINDKNLSEIPLITKYINSKGYKIVNLDELLSEDI